MPGKLCIGEVTNSGLTVKNSKAFCEGVAARTASATTSNPHAGGDAADAWDRGVALAAAAVGGAVDPADAPCCAVSGATVPA